MDVLLYVQTYAWYPLLNSRRKGCKLKLGIYIDDDNESQKDADAKLLDTVAANRPTMGT